MGCEALESRLDNSDYSCSSSSLKSSCRDAGRKDATPGRSRGQVMRGRFRDHSGLFSYVSPEARVPADRPLRRIRGLVRGTLKEMSHGFDHLYASEGRPSVPPQQLLSALLVRVLYGIRSEQQLVEQPNYSLLLRWFVGLGPDDPVRDATTFTKNRGIALVTGDFLLDLIDCALVRLRKLIAA